MVKEFAGIKYKLDKSEKFDEYMKALGVGLITRKMGNTVSPVIELKVDGDDYTLTSNSTFKNTALNFKLGQEFEQETPDGRKVPTTLTLEGNKLIEKQGGEKPSTIVREFSKQEVNMTLTVDDVVCTRLYKALE